MSIKTAIIGCGRTANALHLPILLENPQFQIVGTYDLIPERAQAMAGNFEGCRVFGSYEEFVQSAEYDFAIVLTTSCTHFSIVKDLVNAGKRVLITKPWVMNVKEADELMEVIRQKNGVVLPWMQLHWAYDQRLLKELIDKGTIGKVFEIQRSQYTFGKRSDWQMYREYGGGYLYNWGPHLVAGVMDLVGEPIRQVYSCKKQIINPGDMEDMFFAMMKSESGVLVNVEHNISTDTLPNWIIRGEKGTITMRDTKAQVDVISYPENQDPDAYRCEFNVDTTEYTVETLSKPEEIYDHIADVLNGKTEFDVSLDFTYELTRVIDAIHESADQNILVNL